MKATTFRCVGPMQAQKRGQAARGTFCHVRGAGVALLSKTQHRSAEAHHVAQVVAYYAYRPAMKGLLPHQQIEV